MTNYTLSGASPAKTRADAVVVGVVQTAKSVELAVGAEEVAAAYGRKLAPLLASIAAKGKAGEVALIPTGGAISSPLLVLVGLGAKADVDHVVVRRAAGAAARAITNAASVALALPADSPQLVCAAAEGFALGGYTFTAYRSGAKSEGVGSVVVLSPQARKPETVAALEEAQVVTAAVMGARDWVNTPPGDLRPPAFAEAVRSDAKDLSKGAKGVKVTVKVHDEVALAELGCGGILGVGQGSTAPPRLVELTYAPKGAVAHLALVGKGITFDSGGLTIKPGNSMDTMKLDMAGAAAVVQATFAIARLGLPIKVSTFAPMAENMPSGTAIRPGDVLTMYGGRTVEVVNTDAEGRLVLADALVRATEQKPDVILDVATLTGAMVVALGDRVGGVLGSDDIVAQVCAAGGRVGEAQWPMPITEEVVERVNKSKIADLLQADWNRSGGGLYAAAFLEEFTADFAWAHLDIAGPAFNTGGAAGYWTPGGTGFAVATLVEYARSLAQG